MLLWTVILEGGGTVICGATKRKKECQGHEVRSISSMIIEEVNL